MIIPHKPKIKTHFCIWANQKSDAKHFVMDYVRFAAVRTTPTDIFLFATPNNHTQWFTIDLIYFIDVVEPMWLAGWLSAWDAIDNSIAQPTTHKMSLTLKPCAPIFILPNSNQLRSQQAHISANEWNEMIGSSKINSHIPTNQINYTLRELLLFFFLNIYPNVLLKCSKQIAELNH